MNSSSFRWVKKATVALIAWACGFEVGPEMNFAVNNLALNLASHGDEYSPLRWRIDDRIETPPMTSTSKIIESFLEFCFVSWPRRSVRRICWSTLDYSLDLQLIRRIHDDKPVCVGNREVKAVECICCGSKEQLVSLFIHLFDILVSSVPGSPAR